MLIDFQRVVAPSFALGISVVLGLAIVACSSPASDQPADETVQDSGLGGSSSGGGSSGGSPGSGGMGAGCQTPGPLEPPIVPDSQLNPPSGTTLVQRLSAVGSQIYTCTETANGDAGITYAWVFKAPAAILSNDSCVAVATHSVGPTWTSDQDGSTVVGSKQFAKTVDTTAVPWLLLKATSTTGSGMFSAVTYIQRVDTTGGIAPADSCDASNVTTDQNVPYTAVYYFYTGP